MGILGRIIATALFASTLLAGEGSHSKNIQGFSYRHEEIPSGPWSIHIVKIDRSNTNLELQTTLPPGRAFGLSQLSSQVKALKPQQGRVIAAINGDYYENNRPYVGDPQGLQIMRGELISAPFDWTCFWIDPSGNPIMGIVDANFFATLASGVRVRFGLNEMRRDDEAVIYTQAVGARTRTRGGLELILEPGHVGPAFPLRAGERYFTRIAEINESANSNTASNRFILSIGPKLLKQIPRPAVGDTVRISTATTPSLKNVQTAIGGGPAILRGGKKVFPKQARVRHPRSVVGWNRQFIFLVEVDGRQRNLSVGMTFDELADYLTKIGCENAMSFDGGGSSTLWALGQVMNDPSEGHERGAANGLAVIAK